MWREERIVEEAKRSRRARLIPAGVAARCDRLGHVVPHHIDWEDESGVKRRARITKVVREEIADSRKTRIAEGAIRYTVIFLGKTHVIYRVGDVNWFLSEQEEC